MMKGRILALVMALLLLLALPFQALAVEQRPAKTKSAYRHQPSRDSYGLRNNSPAWFAFDLLGLSYRWGGQSLKGFDCSGLTSYIYKKVYGMVLPRTSLGQSRVGKMVRKQDLIPGDLVYFKTSRARVSHVGIYIGKNHFIHSTNKRGVIISSLNESYYKERYRGARRIFPRK